MVKFDFSFDASVSIEQRIGFELAGAIWASVLTDDVSIKLHIGNSSALENEKAVGGAIPIFHSQTYGVFKEYFERDATSSEGSTDEQAITDLQEGNTIDLALNGDIVSGNTEILLTSAQAKAFGIDESITLENETVWTRGLVSKNALDGFVVISNNYEWDYNYTRTGDGAEGKLDFLSMALHEIGHNLGFVSGIDGTMDVLKMFSGETRIEDFTVLDLFRQNSETQGLDNTDGSVSSVSTGGDAYLAIGGQNIGDLSTGQNVDNGGDGYQASHWKRLQQAMGIMDPTLANQERLSLSERDLQAMDVLGWDINYGALDADLDLESLLAQAEQSVGSALGLSREFLSGTRTESHVYALGHGMLFQVLEQQMIALGYDELFQAFELGHGMLFQELENDSSLGDISYADIWQKLQDHLFELGHGMLFQEFKDEMFELGHGMLFHMFELGHGMLFQELDHYIDAIRADVDIENEHPSDDDRNDDGVQESIVVSGNHSDDILAGGGVRDLVSGGGGEDIIDGKEGDDLLLGESGNDTLYGFSGADSLYGGEGDDVLFGESGNDKLFGEDGHDILAAGHGDDSLDGGKGRDVLTGDQGNDILDGGRDTDDVGGGEGNDTVIGGEGNDIVSGGEGDDALFGDRYISQFSQEAISQATELEKNTTISSVTDIANHSPLNYWVHVKANNFRFKKGFTDQEKARIKSGDSLIALKGSKEVRTQFSGAAGLYDIVVGYYDEDKGESKLELKTDEDRFRWSSVSKTNDHLITYTIRGVELASGDDIRIKRGRDDSDKSVQLEYIDIISTTQGTELSKAHFYDGHLYLNSQTKSASEALSLGGSIAEAEKNSNEETWIENTLGTTKNVIKISAESSQFTLLQDASQQKEKSIYIEAESLEWNGKADYKDEDYASNEVLVEAKKYASTNVIFTGESGLYTVSVGYSDKDGKGHLSASLAEEALGVGDWQLSESEDLVSDQELASSVFINNGDKLQLAVGEEKVQVDYISFIAVEEGADEESSAPISDGVEILIEAEDMLLSSKAKVKSGDFASGGSYIELEDDKADATATTLFTGETGYYDILIGYYDGNKGEAELTLKVGEEEIKNWYLDQSLGQKEAGEETFVEKRVASAIKLTNTEDAIQILGRRDQEDKGFVDYIKLVKVEPPEATSSQINLGADINSDILRGNGGNDVIYGGEGNDLIYGEDEFDDGLGAASSHSDALFGGVGNDTLWGNSGNDWLEGGLGADTLDGGIGADTLDGSDAIAQGAQEIDLLSGGLGADRFILGTSTGAYYTSDAGNDYASIQDFDSAVDVLQLHGGASDYQQQQNGDDLWISKDQDLIAVLKNQSALDLTGAYVAYV